MLNYKVHYVRWAAETKSQLYWIQTAAFFFSLSSRALDFSFRIFTYWIFGGELIADKFLLNEQIDI